ncbi:MAG: PP2C family protein-serine/threonine phosphatase [Acidimicrobiales bacterium]
MEAAETEGNGRLDGHAILSKLAWGLVSDPGKVRPHNEDFAQAFAPTTPDDAWDRGPLWVVCDGMGGHAAGEVASRLAAETVIASWSGGSPGAPASAIRTAVRAANTAICEAGMESGRRGMGTTVCAMTLAGTDAYIANVGDSRCYRVRDGQCDQLTTDHSRVADMLRMRMITPEQASDHPARAMLTRSLGADLVVQVDVIKEDVRQGDTFVLCSDGLWDVVARTDIAAVTQLIGTTETPTPAAAAARLVDTAIERGTTDNVTAVVIQITSDRPIPASTGRRSLFRRRG